MNASAAVPTSAAASVEPEAGVLSARTRVLSRLGGLSLAMWLRLPSAANEYELQLQLPAV